VLSMFPTQFCVSLYGRMTQSVCYNILNLVSSQYCIVNNELNQMTVNERETNGNNCSSRPRLFKETCIKSMWFENKKRGASNPKADAVAVAGSSSATQANNNSIPN